MSTSSSNSSSPGNQIPRPSGTNAGPGYGQTPAQKELLQFLAAAPRLWASPTDPPVRKYKMSNGEEISCVFWKGRFFITGTDIVKILIFHFQQMGRGILNPKKFEEGVFSDLRNLKPGIDAVLEEPRSEFLEFLHKHGCIRTQKKQKVFFWHRVPHEDLLREAMERNLRRVSSVFQWTQMMNSPEMMTKCMSMLNPGMAVMPPPMMYPNQMAPYMYASTPIPAMHSGMLSAHQAPIQPTPMENRPHPRRTISLSAVDFSSRPAVDNQMPMSPMLGGARGMADINSALSSPLFSPATTVGGETFDDSYFDLSPALEQSNIVKPTVGVEQMLEGNQASPLVIQTNDSTSSLGAEERLFDDPSRIPEASHILQEELDNLATPPSEMVLDSTLNMGSDCFLGDMWTPDKLGSLETPLWDDLAMMMPNLAPNHRDTP